MDSIENIELLTTRKAASLLGFTVAYMRKLRAVGGGPPFVRISSRRCAYRVVDIRAWIHARIRGSNEQDRDIRSDYLSVNPKCKSHTEQKPEKSY